MKPLTQIPWPDTKPLPPGCLEARECYGCPCPAIRTVPGRLVSLSRDCRVHGELVRRWEREQMARRTA